LASLVPPLLALLCAGLPHSPTYRSRFLTEGAHPEGRFDPVSFPGGESSFTPDVRLSAKTQLQKRAAADVDHEGRAQSDAALLEHMGDPTLPLELHTAEKFAAKYTLALNGVHRANVDNKDPFKALKAAEPYARLMNELFPGGPDDVEQKIPGETLTKMIETHADPGVRRMLSKGESPFEFKPGLKVPGAVV
jgi:hypothetical protein